MATRPLRVLYFRNARGINDVTGAESYAFALLQALDPKEVKATLVAAIKPGMDQTPWIIEARRRQLPLELVEVESKFGLQDCTRLRELIRSERADIVHALDHRADIIGLLAARLEKVALVNAFFGWTNFSGRFTRGALYTWADRKAQARADAVITDSGYMASFAGAGAQRSPVVVVHNGVDISRFRPDVPVPDMRERFFGRSDVFVFGMVGRVHPVKGQLDFLKAAREIAARDARTRFLIIGDAPPGWGHYKDEVARAIDELGLTGRAVLTNVPSSEIPAVLGNLDVLMSSSYVESFSYSLLEAMSMRLPIIATDVGGNREMMVHGESGLIVPPGDVPALVREAGVLLADPALRQRLGRAARERVEQHFTLAAMAARTTAIYREVMRSREQGLPRREMRLRVQQHSAVPTKVLP
ncbi:MAG: glycosyltransferase family 4 protein [Burkholderiaceae bacterium]|nr:glycosyltransferase family 4 protein [Burkholderiaceae bacterium]